MLTIAYVHLVLCLGSWFVVLDLENSYSTNTFPNQSINPRYHPFLADQLGRTSLWFMVLPNDLNIAPWVFMKMMKPVMQALAHWGIKVLMYLDSWLIQVLNHQQCEVHKDLTLQLSHQMKLLLNLTKPHLTRTHDIHLVQDRIEFLDCQSLSLQSQSTQSVVQGDLCSLCTAHL